MQSEAAEYPCGTPIQAAKSYTRPHWPRPGLAGTQTGAGTCPSLPVILRVPLLHYPRQAATLAVCQSRGLFARIPFPRSKPSHTGFGFMPPFCFLAYTAYLVVGVLNPKCERNPPTQPKLQAPSFTVQRLSRHNATGSIIASTRGLSSGDHERC